MHIINKYPFAGVAELADARDLKSRETFPSYRFDSGHQHHQTESGRSLRSDSFCFSGEVPHVDDG